MIDLDSPVESVLGEPKDKRSRARNERHRRAARHRAPSATCCTTSRAATSRPATLTALEDARGGPAAHRGRRDRAARRVNTYKDRRTGRPAYRQSTSCSAPTARRCGCRSSRRTGGIAEWQAERLQRRAARDLHRQGRHLPRRVAAHQPADGAVRRTTRGARTLAELSLESIGALYPIYPLTKDVESWDLQKAITFARTVVDELPELLPDEVRTRVRRARRPRTALDWIHAPDTWGQITRAQHRYRFEEALVTQLVLGRRRRAVRAMGAAAARRRRRRAARGVRRAAAVRADARASARSAPRSSTTSPSPTR